MHTKLRQATAVVLFSLTAGSLSWAEGPKITGYINSTYNQNLNSPASQTTVLGAPLTATPGNNLSYYATKANTFQMNAAHLAFTGSPSDGIGYVVEVDAGSDAQVNTSANSGTPDDFDIQEAYLTYKCPMTGINLKFGKFVTLEGIEVVESPANYTISRGLLFGLAEPVTQTGFLLSHDLPIKGLELRAGLANGWDQLSDINEGKTVFGGLGINYGDVATGGLSVYHGPEQASDRGDNRTSVDLTIFTKPFSKLTLGLQGNWGEEQFSGTFAGLDTWSGFGIQPLYQVTDKFSLGGRWEYMDNKDGSRFGTGTGGNVSNFTITPTFKHTENITFRAEYRVDMANKKFFESDSGTFDKKNASQIFGEFIYSF